MSLTIDCERLFDGERMAGRSRVLVEGDRIVSVEPWNGDGDGDLSCRFLMPGLIDSHVHIAGYVEGSPAGAPFEPMKAFLRLLILNGVTTVRDTGNSIETIRYVQEWGRRYHGPTVYASGPLLDVPPLVWPFSRIVRNPERARREVELLAAEGMDFIKSYRNVPREVLAAIVEAASEHGLDVAADVQAVPAIEACELGVRSLEHAINLVDESSLPGSEGSNGSGPQDRVRLWRHLDSAGPEVGHLSSRLRDRGTFVCPTLLVTHRWVDLEAMVNEPYLEYMAAVMPYHQYFKRMRGMVGMAVGRRILQRYMPMPKPSRAEKEEIDAGLANLRELTRRLHAEGVRLVVGTDSPNPSVVPGFSLHQEMALLVASGIPATGVLAAATSRAAELLRRDDLGRVLPGAQADLLLLEGDPTEDVSATMDVQEVVKAGRRVDREDVLERFRRSLDR